MLAQIGALLLILVLLTAGLWMLICILTLFSVLEHFTIAHFFLAGIVACVAGQWLSDLEKWKSSAIKISNGA
jgi:hypothetical protein